MIKNWSVLTIHILTYLDNTGIFFGQKKSLSSLLLSFDIFWYWGTWSASSASSSNTPSACTKSKPAPESAHQSLNDDSSFSADWPRRHTDANVAASRKAFLASSEKSNFSRSPSIFLLEEAFQESSLEIWGFLRWTKQTDVQGCSPLKENSKNIYLKNIRLEYFIESIYRYEKYCVKLFKKALRCFRGLLGNRKLSW